ncbi:MAG: hypothetical protein CBC29_00725 [Methylococcaceae bacterium TMED69]|nr:MAG: hypothetical protein CBC29_00725 [Methylococcaceae bacterium TMED69]
MKFPIEELTISDFHSAILSKKITATELVNEYLVRIKNIDQNGPKLNSIITINEKALHEANMLDEYLNLEGELKGPLHGVPIAVKDQIETAGVMTTFGSIAMDGYVPTEDATIIKKLKDAGAIIIAKTTMPDFATSWFGYSSKNGVSKNPYDLLYDPGGSSGGTGIAIAANLAMVGIGEDPGVSIRLPASCNNLVGLKTTPGMISRAGMSPLVIFQDSAGPMCRTVEDLARVLDVIVGFDDKDPFTSSALISGNKNYVDSLKVEGFKGRRVGVLKSLFEDLQLAGSTPVNQLIRKALGDLESLGAILVDVEISDLDHYIELTSLYVTRSKYDINNFLATRDAPIKTVEEIYNRKQYHPSLELFEMLANGPSHPEEESDYLERYVAREKFQQVILNEMGKKEVDIIVYPTTSIPTPSRKELDNGKWTTFTYPTNTLIAAQSWLPAITVPAGFVGALPVGLEFMGIPYGEDDLISKAYAFEKFTSHRRSPRV